MRAWMAVVLLAALLRCSSSPTDVAGGTSDTGNPKIAGAAYTQDSLPAAFATVRVRPADYLTDALPMGAEKRAASILDTLTDDKGRFLLEVDAGFTYSIEITDRESTAVLLHCTADSAGTTADIGRATLAPFARLSGTVTASVDIGPVDVTVYGLERRVRVDSLSGEYAIDDLPAGAYRLRVSAVLDTLNTTHIVTDTIAAGSSASLDTVELTARPFSAWAYTQSIRLNTTPSGAAVAQDCHHFPLHLSFDASVFDFSQAHGSGHDIRFTTDDGRMLPHLIERWDSTARQAALWVALDTVRGNDSTQLIRMYWGNDTARDLSNGTAVFDTAAGFAGGWLMAETPVAGSTCILDRTANRLHGTPSAAMGTEQLVTAAGGGYALAFDGPRKQYVALPSYPRPEATVLTVCAWVRTDTITNYHQSIVADSSLRVQLAAYGPEQSVRFYYTDRDSNLHRVFGSTVVSDNVPHHIAGVVTTDSAMLFIDGVRQDSKPLTAPLAAWGAAPLHIGRWPGYEDRYWNGTIDELRISRVVRSPAWLRLSFVNRSLPQTLIRLDSG